MIEEFDTKSVEAIHHLLRIWKISHIPPIIYISKLVINVLAFLRSCYLGLIEIIIIGPVCLCVKI